MGTSTLTRGIKFNERVDYLIRDNLYKGMRGIDFRRFVMSRPTGQGIVIPTDRWNEFLLEILKFNNELKIEDKIEIDISDILEVQDKTPTKFVSEAKKNKLAAYMNERKKEKKEKKKQVPFIPEVVNTQANGFRTTIKSNMDSIFLEA